MTFLSILLLAISMLTLQISSIYNKGLTLRAVNESGQQLSAEIQRTLNAANPESVEFIEDPPKTGGRLCVGTLIYAWNYISDPGFVSETNRLNTYKQADGKNIRFSKFSGKADRYCKDQDETPAISYVKLEEPSPAPQLSNFTPILSGGDADLLIRSFSLSKTVAPLGDVKQAIYTVSFTMGTNTADLITSGAGGNDRCDIALGSKIDDEYCAVNKFTFTARAGRINDN